jgi:pyruvate ferredoxin oxidoreductase alpha subunit
VLDTDHPSTWGALTLPEHQMEFKITQHEALLAVKQKYLEFGTQLSLLTGHRYPLFELYEGGVVDQLRDSETVMVFLNSSAGTAKEAVDQLRAEGRRVGLLKPILFRPFPYDEIRAALARVKRVIVYDRSMSYGASSPLLTEIRTALYGLSSAPEVEGRVYGLGGREATAGEIVESL